MNQSWGRGCKQGKIIEANSYFCIVFKIIEFMNTKENSPTSIFQVYVMRDVTHVSIAYGATPYKKSNFLQIETQAIFFWESNLLKHQSMAN